MEPKFDIPLTPSPVLSSSLGELTNASPEPAEDLVRWSGERLQKYVALGGSDTVVRLLNLFVNYLPKDGSIVLMQDIITLKDDEQLRQLKNHLVDAILKPVQSSGGKTPAATQSPCTDAQVQVDSLIMNPSTRNEQSKLKEDCLKRDGYRCKVTGFWDSKSVKDKQTTIPKGDQHFRGDTEVAHILPFTLGNFDEDKSFEVDNKAVIWQCLYRYFPGLDKVVSPETINNPANAITLYFPLHRQFGSLNFAFKETSHIYTVVRYKEGNTAEFRDLPPDNRITFYCNDSSIPMPSPFLLSVHARIGKILHVGGLKGRFEKMISPLFLPSRIDPSGSTDLGAIVASVQYTAFQFLSLAVENCLTELPYISEACVMAVSNKKTRQLCGAAVRLRPEATFPMNTATLERVRLDLEGKLPTYMMPTVLRVLINEEKLPLL
ncbi:hypothetical protein McanMca71_001785 [Microsporum canis]|uniref:HNH nuclease domain-containing protein n=1 Tax=Arthroderma otae (strain ATCC MYA-4605 / CBS 113480) TaxID=554155 RepID=C5FXH7_ARTOC|nr:conserved hypothetical protein [Microsporum canis CBS 113480]EEQ35017.1 conserved hypothetical protein [Microsporum canis CBS 113480]